MNYELRKKNKGFTLIETLIAVTIVGMALAGPLSIVGKSLISASFAKDQITAFYLAQEAIEYVHNLRDTNLNLSIPWLTNNVSVSGDPADLSSCTESYPCMVDVPSARIYSCSPTISTDKCEPLKYENAEHLYTNSSSSAEDSIFTRYLYLSPINDKESSVVVNVSWKTGTLEKGIVLKENIFNR